MYWQENCKNCPKMKMFHTVSFRRQKKTGVAFVEGVFIVVEAFNSELVIGEVVFVVCFLTFTPIITNDTSLNKAIMPLNLDWCVYTEHEHDLMHCNCNIRHIFLNEKVDTKYTKDIFFI